MTMGLIGYLMVMFVVRKRLKAVFGLIVGLFLFHGVLIWRLDTLLAPSIGEGLRFLLSK